ncbi:hypothetical protein D3C72_1851600 [compost metagenome]
MPLFGVILGRLAFGTNAPALLAQARKINPAPVAIWLGGVAFYHLIPTVSTALGATLPTLVLCFGLAFATRPRR